MVTISTISGLVLHTGTG